VFGFEELRGNDATDVSRAPNYQKFHVTSSSVPFDPTAVSVDENMQPVGFESVCGLP
jgi:hypothetical protein